MLQPEGSPSTWSSPGSSQFQSSPFSSVASPPLQRLSELTLRSPISSSSSPTNGNGGGYAWLQELKPEDRGLCLIELLLACAAHVSNNHIEQANGCLDQISALASLTGGPMQRVATYFMKALAARITKSWPGLHRALNSTRLPAAAAAREAAARSLFFDLCPYLKLAFTAVNQTIMEAAEGERFVHVIDLDGSHPLQWVPLLRALCGRPGGSPHLKITAVNDQKQILDRTGKRLAEEADALNVPFQFNAVVCRLENLDVEALRVKTGEAVAVSAVLQLHALLVEDDEPPPPGELSLAELFDREKNTLNGQRKLLFSPLQVNGRQPRRRKIERLLGVLRGLSPKVMVVVEQDSNHNDGRLVERFVEALHFYGAVFDALESTVAQECTERVAVEKHLLGRQIENIVACEGAERVERHERLERWVERLDATGFAMLPLSYAAVVMTNRLLHSCYSGDAYRIVEDRGCLTLCWQDRPLFSVSSWQS